MNGNRPRIPGKIQGSDALLSEVDLTDLYGKFARNPKLFTYDVTLDRIRSRELRDPERESITSA